MAKANHTNQEQARNYNSYAKAALDKCHRCGKTRHHSNECPARRFVNLVEPGEESEEEEGQLMFDYNMYDVAGGAEI